MRRYFVSWGFLAATIVFSHACNPKSGGGGGPADCVLIDYQEKVHPGAILVVAAGNKQYVVDSQSQKSDLDVVVPQNSAISISYAGFDNNAIKGLTLGHKRVIKVGKQPGVKSFDKSIDNSNTACAKSHEIQKATIGQAPLHAVDSFICTVVDFGGNTSSTGTITIKRQ